MAIQHRMYCQSSFIGIFPVYVRVNLRHPFLSLFNRSTLQSTACDAFPVQDATCNMRSMSATGEQLPARVWQHERRQPYQPRSATQPHKWRLSWTGQGKHLRFRIWFISVFVLRVDVAYDCARALVYPWRRQPGQLYGRVR